MVCPKCRGNETREVDQRAMTLGALTATGCSVWVPIVGWILFPVFLVALVVSMVRQALPKARFHCTACRKGFSVPRAWLEERAQ